MKDKPPRVTLSPRVNTCRSLVNWDDESLTLTLVFSCQDDSESKAPNLSRVIDERLGIVQGDYRLVLGNMDILLDNKYHIRSLEIRTNPSSWRQVAFPSIPNNLDAVFPFFQVDYDENNIASYTVQIQVLQDVQQRQLSFLFGDYVSSQWVKVAESVVLGLTLDFFLSEIRLLDVALPHR